MSSYDLLKWCWRCLTNTIKSCNIFEKIDTCLVSLDFYFQPQQNGDSVSKYKSSRWINLLFFGGNEMLSLLLIHQIIYSKKEKKKPFSDVETFSTETHFMSFDPFSASWFTMLDDALISQLLGVRASTTYLLLWFRLCSSCSSLAIWNGWRNSTVFCWLVTHPVSHNAEDKEEYDQNVYNIGNKTKWSIHTTSYLIFKRENKPFISSSMHAVIDQYVTLKKF